MMIKCRPRLVRDSAMCRQSEVLSQISRPSEGRPSGVFPITSQQNATQLGATQIDVF